MPPRKPENRTPLFYLVPSGDDLYFVNNSSEVLDYVSSGTGGFQTCDDDVLTINEYQGFYYEHILAGESLLVESFDPIFDSDFLLQVDITLSSPTLGKMKFLTLPEKGSLSKEVVLLWDTGEVGRYVNVRRSPI